MLLPKRLNIISEILKGAENIAGVGELQKYEYVIIPNDKRQFIEKNAKIKNIDIINIFSIVGLRNSFIKLN